jgi:hypothetical protein
MVGNGGTNRKCRTGCNAAPIEDGSVVRSRIRLNDVTSRPVSRQAVEIASRYGSDGWGVRTNTHTEPKSPTRNYKAPHITYYYFCFKSEREKRYTNNRYEMRATVPALYGTGNGRTGDGWTNERYANEYRHTTRHQSFNSRRGHESITDSVFDGEFEAERCAAERCVWW